MDHETKLDRNEMSTLKRMSGFNLKDRKINMELRQLFVLIPDILLIRRGRLQWFGDRMLKAKMLTESSDVQ